MVKRSVIVCFGYKGSSEHERLRGARNTARMLRKCLSERCGFDTNNITLIFDSDDKDPDRGSLEYTVTKLREIFNQCEPEDSLLVYFLCHGGKYDDVASNYQEGVQDQEDGSDNDSFMDFDQFKDDDADYFEDAEYLMDESEEEEYEIDENDDYSCYNIDFPDGPDLRALMERVPVECSFTLILDSCRSGGMFKFNPSHPRGVMISSCQAHQKARGAKLVTKRWGRIDSIKRGPPFSKPLWAYRNKNKRIRAKKVTISLFAMCLIKVLRQRNGRVSNRILIRKIDRMMQKRERERIFQRPILFCSGPQAALNFIGPR